MYGTTLGYSKTLRVTPETCYHFKNPPTQTHDRLTVTEGTVNRCEANYTMTLTSTNLQGSITVSGQIEPSDECGSCGTGGGGNPQDQNFDVTVTQRVAWAYFTLPSNGTNLTCCGGSTNTVEAKVVLGDAGIPSAGTNAFSVSPSSLGSVNPTNVGLSASGTAFTSFIASTNGGGGTITASASGLKDEAGKDVPNVATNLALKTFSILSQTHATIPADRTRTTVGVGEQVDLTLSPAPSGTVTWSLTGGGTLSATNGTSTTFTAPPTHDDNCRVTAMLQGGSSCSKSFTVLEPTGYCGAEITLVGSYPINTAEAGMELEVRIGPTNVSFYNVQMTEVAGPASNIRGYFTGFSTNDLAHTTAGTFWTLDQANKWVDDCHSAPQGGGGWPTPWSSGSFQWVIPVQWFVSGGPTNSMTGWTQTFTIDASGSCAIKKFGCTVTRTTNDTISTTSNPCN